VKPNKRLVVILGGAMALLLAVVAVPARRAAGVPPPPGPGAPGPGADGPGEPLGATRAELLARAARAAVLTFGRDPFAHRVVAAAPGEALPLAEPAGGAAPRLYGVSICGADRMAIIDLEVVREGERLATGQTVARITVDAVTLWSAGEETVLTLGDER
jgi:hypothetical protein